MLASLTARRAVAALALGVFCVSAPSLGRGEDRVETAAVPSTVLEAGEALLPTVLSPADAERYRRIFELQDEGDWAMADKLIASLEDPLLLGHVRAQRYLHPTKYRSRFAELRDWLEQYNDHSDARRIHRLARRRMPEGAKPPHRATGSLWGGAPADYELVRASVRSTLKLGSARRKLKAKMERTMRQRIRKGWPSGALRVLADAKARRLVDELEFDSWRAKIAAGYFFAGVDEKALRHASAAAERYGHRLALANWTAGLAAWRLGAFERAAAYFGDLARTDGLSAWNRAAGGYWAGRAHARSGAAAEAREALRLAAEHPRTFYGLLARRALELPIAYGWEISAPTRGELGAVEGNARVRRALGLVQVGRQTAAELELRMLAAGAKEKELRVLTKLAEGARMPALALQVGVTLSRRGAAVPDAALYPVPPFEPAGGFQVDRALLYALMRQESGFRVRAKSPAGARGLMQLMPRTARYMTRRAKVGSVYNGRIYQPDVNLALGQAYLRYLMANPSIERSLFHLAAGYNGGPGNLRKWLKKVDHGGDPLLFIESIPAPETRNFIERVLTNLWVYRARLGQPQPSLDDLVADRWPTYIAMDSDPERPRLAPD